MKQRHASGKLAHGNEAALWITQVDPEPGVGLITGDSITQRSDLLARSDFWC